MGRSEYRGGPAPQLVHVTVAGALEDGISAVCRLAGRFSRESWKAATPCPEWRAADIAAHLRCVADDYHEYLDDAPASRLARLMAAGGQPDVLARQLARQNAAELVALPDAPPEAHIAAFAESARAYARRLAPVWELPHHRYRDCVVTVAGMAGAACAEWHLHAWDLARALGEDYRPAAPEVVLAGWRAGVPQSASAGDAAGAAAAGGAAGRPGARPPGEDPWPALLLASGRSPDWEHRAALP